ncbi:organic hydroperoxide resistance protein [Porphyromonadaceae bacterium OttesenSCG-928-L07]|nr:organic hydroperoxide resistance protein [Porphyromonadaceae bacterium OttesenSCG-928-L07]MDL2251965.1 organic hydroperoxide resistance protein [Odoribacter sp. OttesenSCG-928-J03]MDL2283297.1 organic hydroperoxide resistance protein [Odoribacter sp. OttesenSCG-928-G04]
MEVMYTAKATTIGGREGHVKSESGFVDMDLKMPKEMGGPGGATNPEELFAAGYSACFNGALNLAARMKRIRTGEVSVSIAVSLGKNSDGALQLAARIDANVPGVTPEVAKELVEQAHTICPYSRSIKGNVEVELHATNK